MLMKYVKKWIALLGAAFLLLGLAACSGKSAVSDGRDTPTSAEPDRSAMTESGATYTVTFYADNGSILKIDAVPENGSATPPVEPEMSYGNIFTKWTSNFSAVKENMEIHPECQSVLGKDNVFALAGAYGKAGECIIVPLQLCGNVQLSGFDLTVEYDPEFLALEAVFNEDGGVVYNDEQPGQIRMNYVSVEDTVADVDICTFKFLVLADTGETPISVSVNSICAGSEDDSMFVPKYTTIQAAVYIYR